MAGTVKVPRDIAEMAILLMQDRKMQGWPDSDLAEMQEWLRAAATQDIDSLRTYLEDKCRPIRERKAMVDAAMVRIKARIKAEQEKAA